MPDLYSTLRFSTAKKLLTAILALGLPAGSALAYGDGPQRAYDDADARVRAVQYSLDRDKTNLEAARRRVDSITAAREKQLNDLSAVRLGGDGQADHVKADLDKATQDQARLRDQLQSIQKNAEAAKAKIDPIHAAALAKFESTDSFKTTFAGFDKARQELKVPTDAVLDQLAQTREFQDLVAAARTAKANEDKLRDDKNADPRALAIAGDAFIAADNKVQDLEEKALTAEAKIVEGRKRVDEAQATLKQMRDQMEQDLLKEPAFAASVEEMHKQQAALDAAMVDLKKLDGRVADLRGSTDKQPALPQDNRAALRDMESKLDTINSDLAQARQDVGKFESRLQEDQDGLNYARRDRDNAGQDVGSARPPVGDVTVYDSRPVYVPSDPVIVYSPPVYYGPSYYDSGVDVSIGYGYYPSYYSDRYYDNRYYSNHDYYNRYYYGGHEDWRDRDRGYRDHSYRDHVSDDRNDRSRDRGVTDQSSYRNQLNARDSRTPVDHRTSQDNSAARTARDLHTPQTNDEVRHSSGADNSSRSNPVRAQEDVHGRRVTETPARTEPRPAPEPSRAPRSSHVDAPASQAKPTPRQQEAPKQQEAPRHQDAPQPKESPRRQDAPRPQEAPRQQESPRRQDAPQPKESPRQQEPPAARQQPKASQSDTGDSKSRSHMKSQ